ncbi:MAG TPA: ABC transporter permease [Kiritimatiellia bacterium]|nr:ABC transporter permease [Kiritimatiellia bacterium]HRZ12417.1 ABC transporter permease [Kiritimatiellia bacterium]HSA17825.1 ABC transporter permease [Kiritimatiellia bacterium]
MTGWRKPLAFVKRDLTVLISYPMAFFLQFFGIFATILMFFFVSRVFGGAASPHLAEYGGDYFSFVLVGLAFSGYMTVAMNSFAASIREGQMMGTLEAMLVSPTRLSTILISSSLWNYTFTSLRVVFFFLIGALCFGVDLSHANLSAALVVQGLTILSFSALGIVSASFIMVFKQGNPLDALSGVVFSLLGGVLYPVAVLPAWLQPVAWCLPLTYSLRAMRRAMLRGASWGELLPDILALVLFAAVLLPASLYVFRRAVRRARRDGTLTQY